MGDYIERNDVELIMFAALIVLTEILINSLTNHYLNAHVIHICIIIYNFKKIFRERARVLMFGMSSNAQFIDRVV